MNEMYNMALDIHFWGFAVMLTIIVGNLVHLNLATDMHRFAKKMRMVMPIMASMLFLMLFTGAVMMAAKHLDFSLANIIMIVFNIVMIVLESKRYARLKHANITLPDVFERYKALANRLLGAELAGVGVIGMWMLI